MISGSKPHGKMLSLIEDKWSLQQEFQRSSSLKSRFFNLGLQYNISSDDPKENWAIVASVKTNPTLGT